MPHTCTSIKPNIIPHGFLFFFFLLLLFCCVLIFLSSFSFHLLGSPPGVCYNYALQDHLSEKGSGDKPITSFLFVALGTCTFFKSFFVCQNITNNRYEILNLGRVVDLKKDNKEKCKLRIKYKTKQKTRVLRVFF